MSRVIIFTILFLVFTGWLAHAQDTDSTVVLQSDSVSVREVEQKEPHSPRLASILSAVVPGAGQVYNRKYWKLPIVYGAIGGIVYSVVWHHQKFRIHKDAYLIRIDDDPNTEDQFVGQFSDENLLSLQADYRKNRDLSVIFLGVVYALNIIDAAVDGHLFDFDVGEDLTMRVEPVVQPIELQAAPSVGVGLTLRIP